MSEPLTPEEEAALRRVHIPVVLERSIREPKPVWCGHCGIFDRPWPCRTARLLATLDATRQSVPASVTPKDTPDVERLARAMAEEVASWDGTGLGWATLSGPMRDLWRTSAARIAREYAALAASPEGAR